MTKFLTKRVYEPADTHDGYRVLVDRIWPRGVSKDTAKLDEWCKAIAPSNELRKWFGHDPEKFDEFATRYRAELDKNPIRIETIKSWHTHDVVTILYGAHDKQHNQAAVLKMYIEHSQKSST